MKIQIASDLHLNHWPRSENVRLLEDLKTDADLLILAGDIISLAHHNIPRSYEHLQTFCANYPRVLFVPGNHEFYGTSIDAGTDELLEMEHALRRDHNFLALLPGRRLSYWGQGFIGGTMWQPSPRADEYAQPINDHTRIRDFTIDAPHAYRRFEEFATERMCPGDIVVTHHAPSNYSIAPEWVGHPCNRWFVTPEIEPLLIDRKPALWVHGHVHTPFDYEIGDTRVVCNPRGYQGEGVAFNPRLVIEVEPPALRDDES